MRVCEVFDREDHTQHSHWFITKKFDPTVDIDVRATMRLVERKRMIRINY